MTAGTVNQKKLLEIARTLGSSASASPSSLLLLLSFARGLPDASHAHRTAARQGLAGSNSSIRLCRRSPVSVSCCGGLIDAANGTCCDGVRVPPTNNGAWLPRKAKGSQTAFFQIQCGRWKSPPIRCRCRSRTQDRRYFTWYTRHEEDSVPSRDVRVRGGETGPLSGMSRRSACSADSARSDTSSHRY